MISAQLNEVTATVQNEFGNMPDAQLNRKPAPGKWSIGQCIDHLIVSNQLYVPIFEAMLNGTYKHTTWQKISPFTGFIGRKLLDALKSDKSKYKATAIFKPSDKNVQPDIIKAFATQQQLMQQLFDRIEKAGLQDETISSPASGAVTLKTGAAMAIIAEHERRHLKQALRVKHETRL